MHRIVIIIPLLVAAGPAEGWAQSSAEARVDVTLTAEDRGLLAQGEYSTFEVVGGGVAGTFLGLGIGHAVQGRYLERGWIFTAGELGSVAVMVAGMASCADGGCNTSLMVGGVLGMLAFRTWEVIDVWAAPLAHNGRVRRARDRSRGALAGYLLPTGERSAVAGLAVRF